MEAFSKAQTHVEICQPAESPRLGIAEAPPFRKGGFGLRIHLHRSNDTGHKKGSRPVGAGTAQP